MQPAQRETIAPRDRLERAAEQIDSVILGKRDQVRLALACLLSRGHLLIEDLPGMGKTVLAHALATTLGLSYQRIQFTSDLLPADIIGVSIFDRDASIFRFHAGPVFAQLILADEVNRATPKAQSALLEAMEEHQVTAEGETHPLPEPFFVIATQNPAHQIGTFPLPESQLDRFLMRIQIGYPAAGAERELLKGADRRELLNELGAQLTPADLVAMQRQVLEVTASDALIDYVQALVQFTRESPLFVTGLSPRAAIAILRSARAWAYLRGGNGVLPEDVQAVAAGVMSHRLVPRDETLALSPEDIAARVLESVPIP